MKLEEVIKICENSPDIKPERYPMKLYEKEFYYCSIYCRHKCEHQGKRLGNIKLVRGDFAAFYECKAENKIIGEPYVNQ
jgi:hypothetical protein